MQLHKNKKRKNIPDNNRINIIVAIIFLFGIGILFRLYTLQVREYDLYVAKATSQHQVYNSLQPNRGRIFIQDSKGEEGNKLYPLATRKDFALVYVVPKDVEDVELLSEQFYISFNEDEVQREVDELMELDDDVRLKRELDFVSSLPREERLIKEQEIIRTHESLIVDKDYLKLKEVKREEEIESRKNIIINDYEKKLNKRNDPYEPIAKKVDEEDLKKLYFALAPSMSSYAEENSLRNITTDNLIIEDEKIFIVEDGDTLIDSVQVKAELKLKGVGFIMVLNRFYPENNIGSHMLGFVGQGKDGEQGRYGLEGFFNEELSGIPGSIKIERGAGGSLIIINDREYNKPINGKDLILTINRTIQFTACQKLNETALRHGADGGSVIIMEPYTGAILAMCNWPDYDPNNYNEVEDIDVYNNQAIFAQYEPGSTFKSITMAIAMEEGVITPETTYNDEGSIMVAGWDKPIKNSDYDTHGGWGIVDMDTVLEQSLNTGAIYAMQQVGPNVFGQYVKRFGFGEKLGIEMETEASGSIRELKKDNVQEIYAATASYGQGFTATPLQMITAYAALANGGILVKPFLVKEIIHPDGKKETTQPQEMIRIISERTSYLLSGMLVNVIEGGHAKRAGVKGYYLAGKTGTAEVASTKKRGYGERTIHSFIGYGPVEDPKFVMLVKLDDPKDVQYAASSAAPLFGEIAEFLLNYLEIPKERVVRE